MQAEIEEALVVGDRLRTELQAVEEQRQLLAEVIQDYQRGREALEALGREQGEIDTLVPLGGGTFAPARLVAGGPVVAAIGAGVHVESTIPDALGRLEARMKSAESSAQRLAEEARRLTSDMTRLNAHLQALSQGARGPSDG